MKNVSQLDGYYRALSRLASLISDSERDMSKIRGEYHGERLPERQYLEEKERISKVRQQFCDEFEKQWSLIVELRRRLRHQQPKLTKLCETGASHVGDDFPKFLIFNKLRLQRDSFNKAVALPQKFPLQHAICIRISEHSDRLIQGIILRMVAAIPYGKLNIYAADPREGGAVLGEIRPLIKEKSIFPQEVVLTRSQEIARTIADLRDLMDARTQNEFTFGCDTWEQYNKRHPEQQMNYSVLLLNDALSQLSADSCWQLARLMERGPAAGILPIISYSEDDLEDNARKVLRTLVPELANKVTTLPRELDVFSHWLEPEELPPNENIRLWIANAIARAAEKRTKVDIKGLWQNVPMYEVISATGISAPIGWDSERRPVDFKLGSDGTLQHALVAGSTGSGKSNLLHVLIHSLCHRYPPSELQLYMLDFKQGVEFNAYASPALPHARLVATEGDREYGISVLEHLRGEMEKRNRLFKDVGVPSLTEYRKESPLPMPRILLIIDEFQKLFDEDNKNIQQKSRAHDLMKDLLRLGRSAGIHVLLSTQTLSGLNSLSISELIGQLGCRIVLKCTETDSQRVLSSMNTAPVHISSPPEGVINYAAGDLSGNVIFTIPKAESADCLQHLKEMIGAIPAGSLGYDTKIFTGGVLPKRPEAGDTAPESRVMQLGKTLSYDESPFYFPTVGEDDSHLLIVGTAKAIHRDFIRSIANTYADRPDTEVILFQSRLGTETTQDNVRIMDTPEGLVYLSEVVESMGTSDRKRVLMIRNPELCSVLADSLIPPRPAKEETKLSPRAALDVLLAEGCHHGIQVILLSEKPRALVAGAYKKMISAFTHRILFNMNETYARQIGGDASLALREITQEDRAVYLNTESGETVWFRPFGS